MAPDPRHDTLARDLRALGSALPRPAVSTDLVAAVMARLPDTPPQPAWSPRARLLRRVAETVARRRRYAVIVVTVVLSALLGVPAVRAAVAEWFGFAGVNVRIDPGPGPPVAPPPPTVGDSVSLDDARRLVEFRPVLPALLGAPTGIEVSSDHRVLSMTWTDGDVGAVRLDQFDGRLDYVFAKTAPGVEFTSVGGSTALWFDEPHEVVVLDDDGTRRTQTARLAGNTLIWEYGGTVLRLEGGFTPERAIEIADSAGPVP